jgi:hypothetical protein
MNMRHGDLVYISLDDHEHYFYSEDFDECCSLSAAGFAVESIDSTHTRSVFIFKKREGIEEASNAYFAGTLTVSALKLAAARRALKSRLYRTRTIY